MVHSGSRIPGSRPLSDRRAPITSLMIRAVITTILSAIAISLLTFPALEWNHKCSQQWDALWRNSEDAQQWRAWQHGNIDYYMPPWLFWPDYWAWDCSAW